jgi:hypothetical protein
MSVSQETCPSRKYAAFGGKEECDIPGIGCKIDGLG